MNLLFCLVSLVEARDFAVKVHDRDGSLGEQVEVELSGGGQSWTLQLRDDGQDPDGMRGDRLYTAKASSIGIDSGKLRVNAGGKTWTGEFLFEENSDPVILIGLEADGRAMGSTHEVMFLPDQQGGMPGNVGGSPGSPGNLGAPGAMGSAGGMGNPGTMGTPGSMGASGTKPGGVGAPGGMGSPETMSAPANPMLGGEKSRSGPPKGLWLGYGVLGGIFVGLGAIAWTRREPRIPGINRAPVSYSAIKGPYQAGELPDLWVGKAPEGALALEPGPWSPKEIALGLLAVGKPVRVVVGEASQVAGNYEDLAKILAGRAALLWLETP